MIANSDPHRCALDFARSAFQHACAVCGWHSASAASAEGELTLLSVSEQVANDAACSLVVVPGG